MGNIQMRRRIIVNYKDPPFGKYVQSDDAGAAWSNISALHLIRPSMTPWSGTFAPDDQIRPMW
jgi:hypothetical protein